MPERREMRRHPGRRDWPRRPARRLRGRGRRQLRACAGGAWLRNLLSRRRGRASGRRGRIVRASRSSGLTRRSRPGAADRRSTAFAPPGSIAPSVLAERVAIENGAGRREGVFEGIDAAGRLLMRSERGLESIEAADLTSVASLGRPAAGGLVGFSRAGGPSLDDGRQRARVRPARRPGRDRHELRPLRLWARKRASMADGRPRRRPLPARTCPASISSCRISASSRRRRRIWSESSSPMRTRTTSARSPSFGRTSARPSI